MKAAAVLVVVVPLMLLALPGIAGASVAAAILGGGGGGGGGSCVGNGPPITAPGGAVSFRGLASWFGGPHDPSAGTTTASGLPISVPGIAAHPPGVGAIAQENHDRLGGYWLITFPNQRRVVLKQTDLGPSAAGRVVDVTYSALPYTGYTEGNFPTDGIVDATYLGKGPQWSRYAAGEGNQPAPPGAGPPAAGPPGGAPPGCGIVGGGGRQDIVKIAESQVGVHASSGKCQPYGPCEDWCALFTSWVWQKAGVKVPTMPGAAQWTSWGQQMGTWHPNNPQPGDVIEFGGEHVGIVESVAQNGEITIIAGNSGGGDGAVIRHGPTSPSNWQTMGPGPVTGYTSPPGPPAGSPSPPGRIGVR